MARSWSSPDVAKEWQCAVCGAKRTWDKQWRSWGSWMMEDDGLPLLLTCSAICRQAVELMGGPERVLGAVWDALDVHVFHNRGKYKNITRWKVGDLL